MPAGADMDDLLGSWLLGCRLVLWVSFSFVGDELGECFGICGEDDFAVCMDLNHVAAAHLAVGVGVVDRSPALGFPPSLPGIPDTALQGCGVECDGGGPSVTVLTGYRVGESLGETGEKPVEFFCVVHWLSWLITLSVSMRASKSSQSRAALTA